METTKLIEFRHEFDSSEWKYENLVYKFAVPKLHIEDCASSESFLDIVDNKKIRYQRKQGRCKTHVLIHLPEDVDVTRQKIEYGIIKIQHVLCEPLWEITRELCKFSLRCEMDKWMSTWELLKTTIRQYHQFDSIVDEVHNNTGFPLDICRLIADKTIFTQNEWSHFVNEHVIYHLSHALGRGTKGADTLFDKVIREGGLTNKGVMNFIALHAIRKEPCKDWMCVRKHDGNYCIHRRLFETFDLNMETVENYVLYETIYPISEYNITDKYYWRW